MGLISTVVTVGAGMGVDNAASAADIGTQQNPVAVVGAGGKRDRPCVVLRNCTRTGRGFIILMDLTRLLSTWCDLMFFASRIWALHDSRIDLLVVV